MGRGHGIYHSWSRSPSAKGSPLAGEAVYRPRWSETIMVLPRLFFPLAAGVLLSYSTGCGVLSAIANPKAAGALQDPAPMAVILRRADVARATATNVDLLLSTTG